jgi:hypothetical protein
MVLFIYFVFVFVNLFIIIVFFFILYKLPLEIFTESSIFFLA